MFRKIRNTGTTLMSAIAVCTVILLASAFGPTLFGFESYVVSSGSMGRAMPIGSVALNRLVDARAVAIGDIISFRYPGRSDTITHRVVSIEDADGGRGFTTKGDANTSNDAQPLLAKGSIHKVEHVVPVAGYLVRYAHTPLGGLVLIVGPALGLMFDRGGRRRRGSRGGDEQEIAGWSATTFTLYAFPTD